MTVTEIMIDESRVSPKVSEMPGDGVNRFLLCTLVSRSAKQVKARAERAGETLPMAAIIKGVLRSYKLAAKENPKLLSGPAINQAGLTSLISTIMKTETERQAREIVNNKEARLAHANRLGDESKIKVETEALERAVESRARITREFK